MYIIQKIYEGCKKLLHKFSSGFVYGWRSFHFQHLEAGEILERPFESSSLITTYIDLQNMHQSCQI
jgi:hypothetical protein